MEVTVAPISALWASTLVAASFATDGGRARVWKEADGLAHTPAAEFWAKARKKYVLPGLINTHGHVGMSLLRGYADARVVC